MPAITAITTTPIAHRDTETVTCSQTLSQRASSPGISTLASARLSRSMSVSRKMQMNMIVKHARNTPKKPPAMPSTAEIASGTETEICWAPSWRFPPAPGVEPRQLTRVLQLGDELRQVMEEVADAADERHEQQQPE